MIWLILLICLFYQWAHTSSALNSIFVHIFGQYISKYFKQDSSDQEEELANRTHETSVEEKIHNGGYYRKIF